LTVTLISFDDSKLPFVPYIQQDIDTIAYKAVELIIEQMEGTYVPRRKTVPVKFAADVGYPTPEGFVTLVFKQQHNNRQNHEELPAVFK
jgi:hypothetical protein